MIIVTKTTEFRCDRCKKEIVDVQEASDDDQYPSGWEMRNVGDAEDSMGLCDDCCAAWDLTVAQARQRLAAEAEKFRKGE